ncbi:MFS transporter [Streptomyces varsoviensis]|uniref:MFS transporter n=1 Tax=Streptomyces varsoviensis TaxID=67373 RepID=UPI00340399BC
MTRRKGTGVDDGDRQTRWLLVVALTVQFTVALDMAVVNVALPDMKADLGFTAEGLQWVVNAYALAFGGLLMLGGRLTDIAGRRRTLTAALVLFGVASLGGGLVWSPGGLIAARAAQGVAAAALAPVALALITVTFPAGPARSRALGLWGMAGAAGGAIGVLAGGVLTEAAGWRTVLLVNVPIVVFAYAAARRSVPADRRTGPAPRLDAGGALLITAGMMVLVLGVVRTETYGWGSAMTIGTLAAAAVLLAAFAVVELRVDRPLLRMGLLTHRPVLAANVFNLLLASGQFGAFYFSSLYMQQVLGFSATATGAAFLPFCVGLVAGSLVAPRLTARLSMRWTLVAGGALGAAGFGWLAGAVGVDAGFADSIVGPFLVASFGVGMCFVPLGTAATEGVAPAEAGMASGLLNSSRQIGGSVGLAVLVTVAAGAAGGSAGTSAEAQVSGYAAAFGVGAVLLAAAALTALLLPARTGAGEARTGEAAAASEAGAGRDGEREGAPR